jgi:hypothetical protein
MESVLEGTRSSYPESWLGRMVKMSNSPHSLGRLIDVNEYGITYEADGSPEKIRFAPWAQIGYIYPYQREERS